MPNVASTRIGVPKPPSKVARLDQSDVKIALIVSPKKKNVNEY
ncbi:MULTISPECIES: hypothetical protein [unclassified Psychromonas]|nr:hypothetical protein [Psychromonas sp. B3M02]